MGAEHYTTLRVLGIDPPAESTGRAQPHLYPNGLKAEIVYNILSSSNSHERALSARRLIAKVRQIGIDDTVESAQALLYAVLAFRAGARRRSSKDDASLINELEQLVIDHVTRENALAMSDMLQAVRLDLRNGIDIYGWRSLAQRMLARILAQGFALAQIESVGRMFVTTTLRRNGWPTCYTLHRHEQECAVGTVVLVAYPQPRPVGWEPGSKTGITHSDVKGNLYLVRPFIPLAPMR